MRLGRRGIAGPNRRTWVALALAIGGVVVLGVVAHVFLSTAHIVPPPLEHYLDAPLVGVFGFAAVFMVGWLLRRESDGRLGSDRAYRFLDIYWCVAWVVVPRFVLRALCHGAMEELPRSALLIELIDIVNGLKSAAGTPAHRPGIPGSWTFTDGLQ